MDNDGANCRSEDYEGALLTVVKFLKITILLKIN